MTESFNKVVTEALMSKDEVTFSEKQENMINVKLGRARFEHTKRMLRAQRDGKRRLETQREKVLHRQGEEETTKKKFNATAKDSLKNAPSKAKLKRTQKLQKAQAKAMKAELKNKTVFEVDGDGNPHDKVRMILTDVPHDEKNEPTPETNNDGNKNL